MRIRGDRDFVLFLAIFRLVESKERIWRFDSDISNPDNWVDGTLAPNCRGIHFAPINTAPVYIQDLITPELTLPGDGVVELMTGGSIEFKDNKKCINLKPLNYHDWYDYDSWVSDNNVAIPHQQRIPCTSDEVVFPKLEHTRASESLGEPIEVAAIKSNSLKFENLGPFLRTKAGHEIFYNPGGFFTLNVVDNTCTDPYGCLCHTSFVPCPLKDAKKLACSSPIAPEEFCEEICGAYVTFKPGSGPRLVDIRKKLKEYASDTYASRVRDYLGKQVVQVVFSEKQYTGSSLVDAEDFMEFVRASDAKNAQMLKSGQFLVEGGTSTVSIVFGTLVIVAMFFGIVFYLNNKPSLELLITRLNRGRGSVFSVPFFARFDNTDENLIIDGQSETGSILDIAKSFDNPMFGQPQTVPSSSTSTQHENPLYDVAKDDEAEE